MAGKKKVKKGTKTTATILKLLRENIHLVVLGILITAFCVFFVLASFLRFDNFHTARFDLGNMTQTVWNTAHGRIFQLTNPNGQENVPRLAFHADFILIFFAPFYWIWDSPKVLLLFQAVITGLGGVFVYLISVHVLKNKNISLAFAFAYLLNPSLSWSVLFDFHSVVLATTFLLGTIYFLLQKNYRWFLIFAILAALTKEQVWFIIALFGLLIFFWQKKRMFGFAVFSISLLIFYLLIWQIIPYVGASHGHFALTYFENGGDRPTELIKNTLSAPENTFAKLTDEEHTGYLKALFMPLGYLPLIFPVWLVFPIADFVLNLLSDKGELHFIYYHYTATITPFLFTSAIYAVYFLKRVIKRNIVFIVYIVTFTIYGAYTYGPLPWSLDPSLDTLESFNAPLPHKEEIKIQLAKIPTEATLAITDNLGGYMSHRENVYLTYTEITNADYIAFLITKNGTDPDGEELIGILKKDTDDDFSLWYDKYGLTIFKKTNLNDQ